MTVIAESFDTANSDTLGPNLSWTELAGDIDIVSNQAQSTTLGSQVAARADSDLATVNQYAQASVNASAESATAAPGVMVRKDSTATMTFYLSVAIFNTDSVQISKQINGSLTVLATSGAVTLTAGTPATLRLEVYLTNLRALINGTEVVTATDSDVSDGLRTGVRGLKSISGTMTWNNFQAGDMFIGSPYPRGLNGGMSQLTGGMAA